MMTSSLRQRAAKGFTLIELLIVVIIIAILAAIAIPQFANSSTDAQESALASNLNTMRSAIELYRIQHRNVLPGVAVASGGDTTACTAAGGALGNGAAGSADALEEQLTGFSTVTGATCTRQGTGFIFGPYLRAIPNEPITNANTIAIVTGNAPAAPAANATGWRYNTTTGRLDVNNGALDRSGAAFSLR